MKTQDFINEKIGEAEASINYLQNRIKNLKEKRMSGDSIENWIDFEFESSSGLTQEFAQFARDFKKYIKRFANDTDIKYQLINFDRGHFHCSGFIKNRITQKFAYFSISDVRYFPNEWFDHILVRTAKNETDYTGGSNTYCRLDQLNKSVDQLTH